MRFHDLAIYLEKLEKTASRNEITQILSDLFKRTDSDEIDKVCYLLVGQLAPSYTGLDFNLAEKMMGRALALAYGTDTQSVTKLFKKSGDLGNVAFAVAQNQKSKSKKQNLSITQVYEAMMKVAKEGGEGSQERKVKEMAELLKSLDPLSVKYVTRIPINNLRLGFSDMTILDALSFLLVGDKSLRGPLEAAFNVSVDIGRIAKIAKEEGITGIKNVQPVVGIPIRPSLAERLPSAEKMLEKVPSAGSGQGVVVERKYDGLRAQLHIKEGKITLFSRNLENTTDMFPDLAEAAKKLKVGSAIIDGEAIAYDAKSDRFLPFQETTKRKRKHEIEVAVKNIPLKLFVFDILYKDGKPLLDLPFSERRKILESVTKGQTGAIKLTEQVVTDSADKIRNLIKEYLSEGLEGALIKKIDAPYKAGARGYHWVKYKKTTEEGVADTVDCLVMGVNKGRGKRTGFGVGAFLVGVRDGENFKTVSKIGTGLTDEQWKELNKRTKELKNLRKPEEYEVDKNLEPDVWTKPSLVVEILADEITKSPIHTAGLALRFPRLIRFRDEKSPGDTTTLKELEKLYKMQKN